MQSSCLAAVSLISAFSYSSTDADWWARHGIVVISLAVFGITIHQQNRNYMKGWQNARFIAESVLSNAWLFVFSVGQYKGSEKDAHNAFLDAVRKIEQEVELKGFLDIYSSAFPPIADWMQKIRGVGIDEQKKVYIEERLENQIAWYSSKSNFNRIGSSGWFFASLILLIVGVTLTLFVPLSQFSALGFLSTIAASILTWRQTKRFDELKVTYAVAAKELQELKARFELETDEPDNTRFVEEAEKSISREHKLWFNWTYIS